MSMSKFENAAYDLGISVAGLKAVAPTAGGAAPTATTATAGTVLQAAAQADVGGAPSQSDFNNLLAALRAAGIMEPSA